MSLYDSIPTAKKDAGSSDTGGTNKGDKAIIKPGALAGATHSTVSPAGAGRGSLLSLAPPQALRVNLAMQPMALRRPNAPLPLPGAGRGSLLSLTRPNPPTTTVSSSPSMSASRSQGKVPSTPTNLSLSGITPSTMAISSSTSPSATTATSPTSSLSSSSSALRGTSTSTATTSSATQSRLPGFNPVAPWLSTTHERGIFSNADEDEEEDMQGKQIVMSKEDLMGNKKVERGVTKQEEQREEEEEEEEEGDRDTWEGPMVQNPYDPAVPNNFEMIRQERERHRQRMLYEREKEREREREMWEIEQVRLRQEQMLLQMNDQQRAPPSHTQGTISHKPTTGDEAYLARLRMSQQQEIQSVRYPVSIHPSRLSPIPTRVVLLMNVASPDEVDDDLVDDIRGGCEQLGTVTACRVEVASPQESAPEAEIVKVWVTFADINQAQAAHTKMNGRSFGPRVVVAYYGRDS